LFNSRIGYGSLLRVALTAAATLAGSTFARAGASDFDPGSLIGAGGAASLKPPDSRLRAQVPEQPGVEQQTQEAPPAHEASFGVLSGAWDSKNFLGEISGLRTILDSAGISLNIAENAELFGNVTGGARQSFSGNGLTTMTLQLDTKKAFGFDGGTFNVSGLHIWGGNLTETNLLALQTLTGIEADRSLRLWELWYDQKFGDKFDVKLGAQSIDQEFMTSISAGYFLNSAMGWGELPAANLPGGGVAYPLASLGVRAQAQITDALTVLGGVYSGSPLPAGSDGSQLSNPSGIALPLNTGVLAIAELQYSINGGVGVDKPDPHGPLPGTYKIGGWYDSESFDDLRYDNLGLPLASDLSNGVPATHHGNYSIYALADQTLWRAPDGGRSVTAFLRPMFTTFQDRSLVSFSINGGLTLRQPFAGRDNDVVGLGFGVAQISSGAANFARDMQFFQPSVYAPAQGAETFLEATYQAQILPSVVVQPDIQYIINPGGGIANPNDPWQKVKNELLLGIRTNITF
jgi:porin